MGSRRCHAEEQAMVEAVPEDTAGMLRAFGVAAPEAAYPRLQDALQYPTLNVRGMVSSFVGAGARTIIPDSATAAIDIRLVKETRADAMIEKIRAHVRKQGYHIVDGVPDDATRAKYPKIARLATVARCAPKRSGRRHRIRRRRRSRQAIRQAIGVEPVHLRTLGGTVPICAVHRGARFSRRAGADRQLRQQPARREREPEADGLWRGSLRSPRSSECRERRQALVIEVTAPNM